MATTRLRRKPALPSSAAYSASVRSWPPGTTRITMSSILPGCGVSPAGNTISTIKRRPSSRAANVHHDHEPGEVVCRRDGRWLGTMEADHGLAKMGRFFGMLGQVVEDRALSSWAARGSVGR